MNITQMSVAPEIGMGVTYGAGSDCYPGTIIYVSQSGHKIKFVPDDYRVVKGSGHDGTAEYEITPEDPATTTRSPMVASWSPKQKAYLHGGGKIAIGFRRAYFDPSF